MKKMTFEEFKEYVVMNINDMVPEDVKGEARVEAIHKPNLTYTGLTLTHGGNEALPTANLEAFYELYQGTDLATALWEMVKCLSIKPPKALPFEQILEDWDTAKKHLAVRLIRQKGNEALMDDGPVTVIDDLMLIYTVNLENEDGTYSARINNGLLQKLQISEEELKEKALQLAAENQPAQIIPFTDAMTVITNTQNHLGAAAIFYPGMMEKLSTMLGGSYFLIPSSIHEWIAVPEGALKPEELLRMLLDANKTVVEEKDILSDHLYRYDPDAESFERVLFEEDLAPAYSRKGGVLYA